VHYFLKETTNKQSPPNAFSPFPVYEECSSLMETLVFLAFIFFFNLFFLFLLHARFLFCYCSTLTLRMNEHNSSKTKSGHAAETEKIN